MGPFAPWNNSHQFQKHCRKMLIDSFDRLEDYLASNYVQGAAERLCLEEKLFVGGGNVLRAHCWSCDRQQLLEAHPVREWHGGLMWRETLRCPGCMQTARKRFGVHLLHSSMQPNALPPYFSEQLSYCYAAARAKWPNLIGSEYAPSKSGRFVQSLKLNYLCNSVSMRVRHEDLTCLTLADASVGGILCMDVLEHIPDTPAVLREARRVLTTGAPFVITVPFLNGSQETAVRAVIQDDGSIRHLLEPEYHGDPLNRKGVLCFYHFGWDLLDALRDAGFARASVQFAWDPHYGYLTEQSAFVAWA